MKINWKVRVKNVYSWSNVFIAIFTPIMAYFGLTGSDMTTWDMVIDTGLKAISNPYVCVLVIVSIWNAIQDPTTKGISDSERALSYTNPV